jgi:hypothetical protein
MAAAHHASCGRSARNCRNPSRSLLRNQAAPVVNVVFVTDSRCKECAKFERGWSNKRMVQGAVVTES